MAYQTYISEALVCGSRAHNTSDRSYLLFTREAGMLYAQARSVREERSKQRFALQEFSYVRATLIHGKSGWRVAGVEAIQNVYAEQPTREARGFVRSVLLLLRRLIQGETAHPELFDEVVGVLSNPIDATSVVLERVLTLRILALLGYIAVDTELAPLIGAPDIPNALLTYTKENEPQYVRAIEAALRESHL